MELQDNQLGWIYVVRNDKHPDGVVKIGQTTSTVNERLNGLNSNTGSIGAFSVLAAFPVQIVNAAEKCVHDNLKQFRYQSGNSNREFFEHSSVDEIIKETERLLTVGGFLMQKAQSDDPRLKISYVRGLGIIPEEPRVDYTLSLILKGFHAFFCANPDEKLLRGSAAEINKNLQGFVSEFKDVTATSMGRRLAMMQAAVPGMYQKQTRYSRVWFIPRAITEYKGRTSNTTGRVIETPPAHETPLTHLPEGTYTQKNPLEAPGGS
jgi:T5orf172 domain